MTHNNHFAHQRLDAFHIAMELTVGVEHLSQTWPHGHADLKDQLRRAASATMRNIAEGANRWTPRDKTARFIIAQGECSECDATLEMAAHLDLGHQTDIRTLRELARRIGAMLTGLIRQQQRRSRSPS